jgi:DNA-binding response OmpR family regulator
MILRIFIPDDQMSRAHRITRLLEECDVCVTMDEPVDWSELRVGGLVLYPRSQEVLLDGKPVHLTRREFQLLFLLLRNVDAVVTYQRMLEDIWGYGESPVAPIKTLVTRLRPKLGPVATCLRNIPGCGYVLSSRPPLVHCA